MAQDPGSPPNFGLVRGQEYTIQWPAIRGITDPEHPQCKQNNPDKCFVKPPCDGDSRDVKWAVKQLWDQSSNGYWGFSGSSDITQSGLDGKQTQPISVGMNIDPILSNGNMASQAGVLDQRAQQDYYNGTNNVQSYLDHPDQNDAA